jgi:hypothetical protein
MDFGQVPSAYAHPYNIEGPYPNPGVLANLHNTMQLQPPLNANRPVPPMEAHQCVALPAMPVSTCNQPYPLYQENSAMPSPRGTVPLSHPATKKRKGQTG